MRAGFRVLVASAWLSIAGMSVALAQTDPAAGVAPLDGCGTSCRWINNLVAPAPAQAPQAQPQREAEEPEADRPRRARRNASRPVPKEVASEERPAAGEKGRRARAAEPARPKATARPRRSPAPAPDDVDETASLPRGPAEVVFVARPDGTHRAILGDLAGAVAPDMTVRTVTGRNAPMSDVLSLPDVDVTVASSIGFTRGSASPDKLVYLAKLFTEELHALAASGIAAVEDLAGKPVYLGPPDSDGELAAKTFLESRGVTVAPVAGSLADAVAGLRAGRVVAAFVLAPKPFPLLAELPSGGGLRFLPLAYRASDEDFHPAALGVADYPGLIAPGERVETLALDAILVAPRWRETSARQQELAAFTTRFFERLGALGGEGRHPKWSETNVAATVDGFPRLKPAQQWIAARLKGREANAGAAAREPSGTGAGR